KAQRLGPELELFETMQGGADEDVAFSHRLRGATPLPENRLEQSGGGGAQNGDPFVSSVDMGLLCLQVGM
ncbi:MAG: hypothetical protein ABIS21_05440, partial [Acidimicrobiales bacterium]